ncbi:MAG: hypothetical protein ACLPKB_15265 [Xanthobacteraceae bacterium]
MLGRALPLACLLIVAGGWPATAQFPPPGAGPAAPQFSPPPGGGGQATPQFAPGPSPGPGGGGMPPCFNEFAPLRQEAEKRAIAVREAGAKHATPQQACELIGRFSDAEAKVVKFVQKNGVSCGIPAEAMKQMKTNHEHTEELHKRVCTAAANPPRPAGPSLSDALNSVAKVPTKEDAKPGRGTFDTLTGNALER